MTDNFDFERTYSFSYTDCEGKVYTKTIQTPGATWMECINDYVRFLESVFQYDIMKQVRLEEPSWMSAMEAHHSDYIDPWTGEYFVKDGNEDTGNS